MSARHTICIITTFPVLPNNLADAFSVYIGYQGLEERFGAWTVSRIDVNNMPDIRHLPSDLRKLRSPSDRDADVE